MVFVKRLVTAKILMGLTSVDVCADFLSIFWMSLLPFLFCDCKCITLSLMLYMSLFNSYLIQMTNVGSID